jgi:hypothetical protein
MKTIAAFITFFCSLLAVAASAQNARGTFDVTELQAKKVILAVEDEVYDLGYQKRFYMVGTEPGRGLTRLPIYIEPTLKQGEGTVIYKLMPHGEVIRGFHFNNAGLAVLEGDPDGGFPPTQPNTLTLYMDDDEVCHWKHSWMRQRFEISDTPSEQRIREAGERQKQRLGYSAQDVPPKDRRKSPPEN